MEFQNVVSLLSGIALFLFGMTLMGDGLKKVAGNKLELILFRLSDTPLKGLLLGTGVTAAIQSSCATSVMAVGFVNAGMMKVRQSIHVILGAILGTSVTGWVICLGYIEGAGALKSLLSTATLTGVVAVIGILLRMFTKNRLRQHIGDILLGFAVLMFGMRFMSEAVSPLSEEAWFLSMLTSLSNPVLGILAGAVFTAVLQSASAAVGIVQALAVTGVMAADEALPLLMGIAIGAAAPVLLAAVGAGVQGKRAALVYPVAGIFGVAVTAAVFYALNAALRFGFMETTVTPFTVATINTALRVAMVALTAPLSGLIERIVTALVKEKKQPAEEQAGPKLEERFLTYPALAVEQSRMAVIDMAAISRKSVGKALRLLTAYSPADFDEVKKMENAADGYEDAVGSYLMRLTGKEMTRQQNADVAKYLRALTDLERISDHALNLAESAQELNEKKLRFSDEAQRELGVLTASVTEILHTAVRAFEADDPAMARRVEPLEERIDELCDELKRRHVDRLQRGDCTIAQGFVFNDLLTNLERIADHCSNLAVAMIEVQDNSLASHDYLHAMKEREREAFSAAYAEYAERYTV